MGSNTSQSAGMLESEAATQAVLSTTAALPRPSRQALPDKPLVTIKPSKSWVALDLQSLWSYHELLLFLTWRDLKVRYKQTVLGVAWVVMQPLLLTLIFTFFMSMVRAPSDNLPYPLLIYAGLLPWTFFSSAVSSSGVSLVGNAHLITKVYFPRLIVPTSAILARLIDLAIAFVILIGMIIYYRVALTWNVLSLPLLVVLTTLLALALGLLISALNVKYRDVGVMLPVLVQLWMFVSPVFYPLSIVPAKWQWLYSLNPMVGIIDNFRAAIFGQAFNWQALAIAVAVTFLLLVCSAYMFRRVEKGFADII